MESDLAARFVATFKSANDDAQRAMVAARDEAVAYADDSPRRVGEHLGAVEDRLLAAETAIATAARRADTSLHDLRGVMQARAAYLRALRDPEAPRA